MTRKVTYMDNKDILQAAIFYMIGEAHWWNTLRLANLFRMTSNEFRDVLREMEFDEDEISRLNRRTHFKKEFCMRCGITSTSTSTCTFCSDECHKKFNETLQKLQYISDTGLVPTSIYNNNLYYNVNEKKGLNGN